MISLSYSLCLALLLSSAKAQSRQQCYFPDGSIDTLGVPCDTSAENSHCCSQQGLCLSNGLCFLQGLSYSNRISRQSCTDSAWRSPRCPQYCADTYTGQGTTIWLGPENPNGAFCCGQPYNVTSEKCVLGTNGSLDPFDLLPGNVYFDREGRNSTDLAAFGSTNSTSAGASGTPAAATVTGTSSGDGSGSSIVAVGAGVGASLGIVLLVVAGLLVWQWRRAAALQKQLNDMKSQSPQQGAALMAYQYSQSPSPASWGPAREVQSLAPPYTEQQKQSFPGQDRPEPVGYAFPTEMPAVRQDVLELEGRNAPGS